MEPLLVAAGVAAGVVIGVAVGRALASRHPLEHPAMAPVHAEVSPPTATLPPDPEAPGVPTFLPGPLAQAVDRIEHGVVIVDGDGEELYRNTAARRIGTARDSRSLVESAVVRLLHDARLGDSQRESVELFGPPAQLYDVTAHPFRLDGGVGAMAVVEDRSDARRTETVRRDFVANISHELKTPVGALGLLAETILGEEDPAVMRRLANRMVVEAERAARTIDDLLELSRIEFADDAEFSSCDVATVVSEAVSRISTAAEQAEVTVRTGVPGGLEVHGDRRQLVSAVFNLLDNAVKYSPPGSEVDVQATREEATSVVTISVSDHGIGIPRRSLDRIFERFYRVDRARSRHTGGTGLGLAIVRHVVSNHGGQILAESVEGQGSVFTLMFLRSGPDDPGFGSDAVPRVGLAQMEVPRRPTSPEVRS